MAGSVHDKGGAVKPCVYVTANARELLPAHVAGFCLRQASGDAAAFDVRILEVERFPELAAREGRMYLRDGRRRVWRNSDHQSFGPLRFAPPVLMGYAGRALVIDPDVYAVGDVLALFRRDMANHAIMCRRYGRSGREGDFASSVMLLDCGKLVDWRWTDRLDAMFAGTLDYRTWHALRTEPAGRVGLLEPEWNDFDRRGPDTRMVHLTGRLTQPWRTGLPVEPEHFGSDPAFLRRELGPRPYSLTWWWWRLRGHRRVGRWHYARHRDALLETFFFDRLRECLDAGVVTEALIQEEVTRQHIRPDTFALLRRPVIV
jgi:hypothetical protein